MAGAITESELTTPVAASVRFTLAAREQDAAIRQLLRLSPTSGAIRLTFEREPDYFQSTHLMGADSQTVLGFSGNELVGIGRCTFRPCHLNGQVQRVGYLSELRLIQEMQGRFDIVRRGYRFFQQLHNANPADFYFTSIAADNDRSIRLLERNLPGMPTYQFMADFTTLLIPVDQPKFNRQSGFDLPDLKLITGNDVPIAQLISFLNEQAITCQLSPLWREDDFDSLKNQGLSPADFRLLVKNDAIVAAAALWDQRNFKQTIVRGYDYGISTMHPLINWFGKMFGSLGLPPIGSTLKIGFIFPSYSQNPQWLAALLKSLLPLATEKGLQFFTLGFAGQDHRLSVFRRQFRSREYCTRLYQVAWGKSMPITLDGRPFSPEVALL